jgi:hypothetical protein
MKEAVKQLRLVESVYEIIAISKLDDSIAWEDIE